MLLKTVNWLPMEREHHVAVIGLGQELRDLGHQLPAIRSLQGTLAPAARLAQIMRPTL